MVDQAVIDLAQRLHVAPSTVTMVSVTPVTWPNPQLGCGGAQLDDATPTPGFRILLEVANRQYDYYSNMQRVIWCDKGQL